MACAQCLSEDFVMEFTNQQDLSSVRELSLEHMNLTEISAASVEKLTGLQYLDLSNNQLCDFPDVLLPNLEHLDIRNNHFRNITFVKNFPKLQKLFIVGNELEESDKYIAVALCKELQQVNMASKLCRDSLVDGYTKNLEKTLRPLWDEFVSHGSDCGPSVLERFKDSWPKLPGPPSLLKYTNFIAHQIAQKFFESSLSSVKSVGSPKKKILTDTNVSPPKKRRKLESSAEDCTVLPPVAPYFIQHCLRCHSGIEGPNDCLTQVLDTAFEPENEVSSGSLVATCGGSSVCIIDCASGRVTHRFKDEDERFCSLAWTTFATEEDGRHSDYFSILAVGCQSGNVHLILPRINYRYHCIKRFKTGVSTIVFHPVYPTLMFTGSKSGVKVWDIGIPSQPKCNAETRHLHSLSSPEVLRLSVSADGARLIAACMQGCYLWHLPDQLYSATGLATAPWKTISNPHCKLLLSSNPKAPIEAVTVIGNEAFAAKTLGSGVINVWRATDLENVRRTYEICSVGKLEWANDDTMDISMDSSKDGSLLVAGGISGCVWVYNTAPFLQLEREDKPKLNSKQLSPSAKLEWPSLKGTKFSQSVPIVNCVCVSDNGKHIVGATDNNLVLIWSRSS